MQTEYPHRKFYRLDAIRDELSPQAAERFDTLALFDQLRLEGATEATALKAAGCSRATLYRWKRRLREQGVRALADRCRRPRRVRQRQWTAAELELVRQARLRFPLWGRAKIRAVLARERGFAPSESATGRMIARLVRTGRAEPVAFHYGRTKPKRRRKFDRHARRWRYGTRGRKPGQMVQIDHLSVAIEAGFAVKESEAVCPVSKLCYMRAYSRATATCATRFLDHLIRQAPFNLESVQVDGGSEFMAEFETACRQRGIELFVLPPRSPNCNGCVERANAVSRYEFHQFCDGELSVGALNVELAEFERFYNDYRPHQALGQAAPMQAYNENFKQSALAA